MFGDATEGGEGGGEEEERKTGAGQGDEDIQLGSLTRPGLTCAPPRTWALSSLRSCGTQRQREVYITGVPIDFENITKTCHPLRVHPLLLVYGRELEHNILASQTTVHGRERVQLVFQRCCLFRIKDPAPALSTAHRQVTHHLHFQQFRAVYSDTRPLPDNLGGEDEVLENLLVH